MRSTTQPDLSHSYRPKVKWRRLASSLALLASLAACAPAPVAAPLTPISAATSVPSATLIPPAASIPSPTPIPPTVTPPLASPTAVVPTPAPTSAAAGSAPVTFTLDPGDPIFKNGFGWAGSYLDPGAMIVRDGVFHMFFNGVEGWPAPVGVGYATSTDGIHFTPQGTQPVFGVVPLTGSASLDNGFATSVLVQPDGTWVLYYYHLSGQSFAGPESIGRATAPGPDGPWTPDPQPVLMPGPAGAWDAVQATAPDVVPTASGYVMYYDGMGASGVSMIGMATSPDGRKWTKYDDPTTTAEPFAESDPVLQPLSQGWDMHRVTDPNVLPIPGGWAMVYASNDGAGGKFSGSLFTFGYATSADGLHWTQSPSNPVLSNAGHPNWQASYLVTLVASPDGNRQYLYFDAATGAGTNIYLATHAGPLSLLK